MSSDRPLHAVAPNRDDGWSVGVVVPARNEAEHIAATIDSVRASLARTGVHRHCVVVVADDCQDDTVAEARRTIGPASSVIATRLGNVGAARRAGTSRALRLLRASGSAPDRTWLLTTDADSLVGPDWAAAHLRHADAGAAAVAGVVRLADDDHVDPGLPDRFTEIYTLYPDGTHPHVHGANLGVRADAYLAVGGWESLRTAEDHALWNRVRSAGWPTVSAIDAWVTTSHRRTGRAPHGFADFIDDLARGHRPAVGAPRAVDPALGRPAGLPSPVVESVPS